MITTLHIIIIYAIIAVVLLCAVWIGLRRPTRADPFFHPFGDMPGFTEEQLRQISARSMLRDPLRRSFVTPDVSQSAGRLAVRTDDDGGRPVPSGPASICNLHRS